MTRNFLSGFHGAWSIGTTDHRNVIQFADHCHFVSASAHKFEVFSSRSFLKEAPFFGKARLVYWDLTQPMFVLRLCNIVYDTPIGQVGFPGNERNPSLLVWDDQRMTLYGKALGVGWWMESLGKVLQPKASGPAALGFWPWDFPRDSIHHSSPSAFPNNVPLFCCWCTIWQESVDMPLYANLQREMFLTTVDSELYFREKYHIRETLNLSTDSSSSNR